MARENEKETGTAREPETIGINQKVVMDLLKQNQELMEQNRMLMNRQDDLYKQLLENSSGAGNESGSTRGVRSTQLIAELSKRIKVFVYNPEEESVFPVWYQRYEHVFTEDGKDLDDKARVRLLLEKLEDTCFKQFSNHVLPENPWDVKFDDAVKALKEIFDAPVSKFTQRYKCWTNEFDKSHMEDDQQYGDRINERFHKVMDGMELEDYKVLRFLVGLKGRDDAEHLPFLLSYADRQLLTAKVTLQDLIRELKKLRTYKADGQLISKPNATIRAVKQQKYGNTSSNKGVVCWNCAQTGHTMHACTKRLVKCRKCNKDGHLDQYCFIKKPQARPRSRSVGGKRDSWRRSRTDSQCSAVKAEEKTETRNVSNGKQAMVNAVRRYSDVIINGKHITFQSDTGSDVTIMSKGNWEKLGSPELKPSNRTLKVANNSNFDCFGTFDCQFTLHGELGFGTVYVVTGQNLLGLEWMNQIGAMRQGLDAIGYAMKLESVPTDIGKELEKEFPEVFRDGLGKCVKETATLELKANVRPRFHKPRVVPHAALESVEKELERLLSLGVIEKVNHSQWAAPIVAVKKKTGVIRVCADFSTGLNSALEDNEHPLPVPEDIFARLNGGKIFSQIDLSDAYLQVEVAKGSRQLVTINTHKGLYQYKRLPFGVKTAPAIFQSIMDKMCSGLKGVACYLDDIIIKGDSEKEHYDNIVALFKRIKEYGFHLKLAKCSFNKKEIKFLGYTVDAHGRRPDKEKIDALAGMPAPENVSQLRSFLGMVSYYGNFIPHIKEMRGPLDQLTHKDTKWNWDKTHDRAFQKIREVLVSDLNLCHYSPDLPIVVSADACEYGVGGVISHRFPDGSEKPIQHFSRALSAAEKNYGQIEKEALALITAVKKFHKYIYGRKFLLQTDHKPLLTIYGSKKGLPGHSVNRLIRWGTILLGYEFDIEYVNTNDFGKADALSRLLRKSTTEHEDVVIAQVELDTQETLEECIRNLPVTKQLILQEMEKDLVLQEVKGRVQQGSWPKNSSKLSAELAPYLVKRDEMHVVGGFVMVGERVVVPSSLRLRVLREIHRGHPGNMRMKQLARGFVYWPGLDKEIEQFVKNCENCQLAAKTPTKVPLRPWPEPDRVWQRIHIDFAGPDEGIFYLVIVDAKAKWPEVVRMKRISAILTVKELQKLFSRFGYPETIVTDNGTQFTSQEFKTMCLENGIEHIRSAPYHPQSNGQAERFVDILKRGLRKLNGEGGTAEHHLYKLLLTYRSTPSAVLENKTPAEVFLGRKIRTRLSLLVPDRREVKMVIGKPRKIDKTGKEHFDSRNGTKSRDFGVSDKVYVKVHHGNNWIWKTGVVIRRKGNVNYEVDVSGRKSTFHANQMRLMERALKENDGFWLDSMLHTFNLPVSICLKQMENDNPPGILKKSEKTLEASKLEKSVKADRRRVQFAPHPEVVPGPAAVKPSTVVPKDRVQGYHARAQGPSSARDQGPPSSAQGLRRSTRDRKPPLRLSYQ